MNLIKNLTVVFLTSILLLSEQVRADIVGVDFEVVLDVSVNDPGNVLDGSVSIGDMIVGRYYYDTEAVDTDPDILDGRYYGVVDFQASVGNYTLTSSSSPRILVVDGQGPGTIPDYYIDDQYYLGASRGVTLSNSTDSFSDVSFVLHLAGNEGDIWSSDELPSLPQLSSFRGKHWILIGVAQLANGETVRFDLDGTVTYFQPVTVTEPVTIDIKPGSDTNCFNVNGHGVIPVAVLSDDTFDAATIDVTTVSFGGLDVRVRGNKAPLCSLEDVTNDGLNDLVCQFQDDPENWDVGEDEATLTGETIDGREIEGTDSICIVP